MLLRGAGLSGGEYKNLIPLLFIPVQDGSYFKLNVLLYFPVCFSCLTSRVLLTSSCKTDEFAGENNIYNRIRDRWGKGRGRVFLWGKGRRGNTHFAKPNVLQPISAFWVDYPMDKISLLYLKLLSCAEADLAWGTNFTKTPNNVWLCTVACMIITNQIQWTEERKRQNTMLRHVGGPKPEHILYTERDDSSSSLTL